ncbi:ABC transporter substrate-binding protein [Natrinema sp. 1APR25-10V2]|uniref:ABC transporter substrate-binding protein n=1 Tax=Natrinema sp. 1APR25-10V2 TaxID=2951081 RepID=UPI002874BA61|nr:ABC transporter substrate-binding protein [Natrinema sp. 1APR25-10V2]MDS0477487.1 ABC transporter substrate-binding protein [Natrinema sp. 1APR25-10V2]
MPFNRRTVLKGMGAAGIVGVAGCAGGPGGDDTDAMVGVLQPVTGDLGNLGGPIRDAAILPGTQLENEGSDFTIDIREEDTESTADAGLSGAQSLVDAGYPAITGAASSQVTITVAEDILIPNEVVGISPASTAPSITDLEDEDFIFRTAPSDALQGEVMAQVAYEERGLESAASFYLNNDYGQQLSDSFVGAFEELGGTVTNEVAFESEQPSYTSALESALADDPDAMIVIGYPASGEVIFRDYYSDFDTGQTIMVTDGLRDSELPGNVDNPMENVVGTAPLAAGPEQDAFAELYQGEYDSEPGVFTAQAYDATAVNILASIAAGETDGPAIRDSIRDVANPDGEDVGPSNLADALQLVDDGEPVNYQGASSGVNFDDNGDMQAVTYEIFEFGEGGIETVEEIDFEV